MPPKQARGTRTNLVVMLADPLFDESLMAIACKALRRKPATLGLLPMARTVDVEPFGRRLATALHAFWGAPVALFASWPRWQASAASMAPGAPYAVQERADEIPTLSLLPERDPLLAAQALSRALGRARTAFAHVVVDLTGFPLDTSAVLGITDGVIPVALAGVTREQEILRLSRFIPSERNLGFVLLG